MSTTVESTSTNNYATPYTSDSQPGAMKRCQGWQQTFDLVPFYYCFITFVASKSNFNPGGEGTTNFFSVLGYREPNKIEKHYHIPLLYFSFHLNRDAIRSPVIEYTNLADFTMPQTTDK